MRIGNLTQIVVPAKAGTHLSYNSNAGKWVPAFAGTTMLCRHRRYFGCRLKANGVGYYIVIQPPSTL
jgi:hypothetical protein